MKKTRIFTALGLAAVLIIGSIFFASADDVIAEEVEYEAMKKRIEYLYDKAEENRQIIEEQNIILQEITAKQDEASKEYADYAADLMNTAGDLAAEAQIEVQAAIDAQAAADAAIEQADADTEAIQEPDQNDKAAATQTAEQAISEADTAQAQAVYGTSAAVQAAAAAQSALDEALAEAQAEAEEAAEKAAKEQEKKRAESEFRQKVVDYAVSWAGVTPYVWAGNSLTKGTDCSGFVHLVYEHFGIDLPRSSYDFRSCGSEVSFEDAQPGDIICYEGHVALYIGDGAIVHAVNESNGTKITEDAEYCPILTVRRVI